MISNKGKFASSVDDRHRELCMGADRNPKHTENAQCSAFMLALIASAVAAMAIPDRRFGGMLQLLHAAASPAHCYQQQVAPAQYRTVQETVMVAPRRSSPIAPRRNIAP